MDAGTAMSVRVVMARDGFRRIVSPWAGVAVGMRGSGGDGGWG